jgi:hypothetical protein
MLQTITPRESGHPVTTKDCYRASIKTKWLLDRPVKPGDDMKSKHLLIVVS